MDIMDILDCEGESFWEEASRLAAERALAAAEWDPATRTVRICDDEFADRKTFYDHLVGLADNAWLGEVPWEGGEPCAEPDTYDIVEVALAPYEGRMREMGWAK